MAQILDGVLKCGVCLDRFCDPKQLPCQHTFCCSCLEEWAKNSTSYRESFNHSWNRPVSHARTVNCPECRKKHNVPHGGVRGFPDDRTIRELLGIPVQDKSVLDATCQECRESKVQAGCDHCEKILCYLCLLKHTHTLNQDLVEIVSETEKTLRKMSHRMSEIDQFQDKFKSNIHNAESQVQQWRDHCVIEIDAKMQSMMEKINSFKAKETGAHEELQTKYALLKDCHQNAEKKSQEVFKIQEADSSVRETQGELLQLMNECKELTFDHTIIPDISGAMEVLKFNESDSYSIVNSISNLQGIFTVTENFGDDDSVEETVHEKAESRFAQGRAGDGRILKESNAMSHRKIALYQAGIYPVLQKDRSGGEPTKCFGGKGHREGLFNQPQGIAVTEDDTIIVADTWNHRIQIFDTSGNLIRRFGSYGRRNSEFQHPSDVCVTNSGQIVVADTGNNRVQLFNRDGKVIAAIGEGEVDRPHSVATNEDGRVFVADNTDKIKVYSTGVSSIPWRVEYRRISEFTPWPDLPKCKSYLAVTPNNEVIVSAARGRFVNKLAAFDSSGKLLWSRCGWGKNFDPCKSPSDLTCDKHGNIVVVDTGSHTVQIFDSDIALKQSFGNEGSRPGEMKGPMGVAVLRNGDIVVSDTGNNRIQIF